MRSLREEHIAKRIVITALFIGIGIIIPSIFHMFNMAGNVFLPMHIPVLICAIICGEKYGGLCGFILPILSSFLTGMPPIFPLALIMSLELGSYGIILGILSKRINIILALIFTLISGRIISCVANFIILGVVKNSFSFSIFITGAFVTALPGIIIQLLLIPLIYIFLKRRNYLNV